MMGEKDFAIAVFPFLKTSGAVRIGGINFRSTDDVEGLTADQATAISEIRQMLYVQDDLRVKSATYAVIPKLDVHSNDIQLLHLQNVRDVVTYLYSAPHEVFGHVFLHPEDVSLALFNRDRVSVFLTRPAHHTEAASIRSGPDPDEFSNVPGYRGLYNFRHPLWVEPGSRLYGPKPTMTLVIAQDLAGDFQYNISEHSRLLLELLARPLTQAISRVFSAIHWYNAANEDGLDESRSILNLAVAFEALLRLPKDSKTDRLVDAISLLLGRTERLEEWAKQFYAARSGAAHEGIARERYFFAGQDANKRHVTSVFGSLMLYGRQVFQLCVKTLIVGIDLASQADLEEKFVTNNERFKRICDLLEDGGTAAEEKLKGIAPIVDALERYRFVASVVDIPLAIAVAQRTAETVEACGTSLASELSVPLTACAKSKRVDGELARLSAIADLVAALEKTPAQNLAPEVRIGFALIQFVWMQVFQRYYYLKKPQQ